jgi:hypothetical protein
MRAEKERCFLRVWRAIIPTEQCARVRLMANLLGCIGHVVKSVSGGLLQSTTPSSLHYLSTNIAFANTLLGISEP